jgi:membrane protease YdiL (CAAX protease family)
MASFTHPLVAYAGPARAGASTARTLLGLVLTGLAVWAMVEIARVGMAATLIGDAPDGPPRLPRDARDPSTPIGALMILGVFLAVWPALWIVLPLVHKRRGASLFGPEGRVDWRHFRWGLAVSLAVGVVAWAPLVAEHGESFVHAKPLEVWAMFAAIALPLVFVQCAAEELLFRGYLLQQFAARSFNVLGWSVLPSLLFAFAHPTESGFWGISWYHFVFGLIMAAVTSRTANLGGAIGLHFGNNLVNLLLIAPVAQVSGLAMLRVPEAVDVSPAKATYLVVMFVGAALFMGWMDLSFIRRWRAMKQAEKAARDAETARRRARAASSPQVAAE